MLLETDPMSVALQIAVVIGCLLSLATLFALPAPCLARARRSRTAR